MGMVPTFNDAKSSRDTVTGHPHASAATNVTVGFWSSVGPMTGSFGASTIAAGAYLWWESDGLLLKLVGLLGKFGPVGVALPGLLMLLGTALLGFALIRMQKG